MARKQSVHFMGIGGSALSGVAVIARNIGFKVSGCDLDLTSMYLGATRKAGIPLFEGHDESHIKNVGIVAVSPALFFQNNNHPEILSARKRGILLTWPQFVGKYILPGKTVFGITGTHGKSTTTVLVSHILEVAKLDPSAIVGAKVVKWDANYRIGSGSYFVIETDEFYGKFLDYAPHVALINNIEFDHPDYFSDEKQMVETYKQFIEKDLNLSVLIVNLDSKGVLQLLEKLHTRSKKIQYIGFTFSNGIYTGIENIARICNIELSREGSSFEVNIPFSPKLSGRYEIKLLGRHNIANAAGAILMASQATGVTKKVIQEALSTFSGTDRRLELIGEKGGIKVYDDYAHHPTAIKATLGALRQKYPENKIWVIVEPHTFSRTKALLGLYKGAFDLADHVIIAPIFKSRDSSDFGVSGESIVKVAEHSAIKYIDSFDKIVTSVKESAQSGDIIIVMGAGKSYELARNILGSL